MPQLKLELIAYPSNYQNQDLLIELGLVNHVHKRTEKFVYQRDIDESSVPLNYIENPPLNSRQNLKIHDYTWSIPANSYKSIHLRSPITVVRSKSYSSIFRDILATNQTFIDSQGRKRPLFYRHVLPNGTTEASIYEKRRGNRIRLDSGYRVDVEGESIYTNYTNYFDRRTGSYAIYYVVYTDSNGETHRTLLNPEPVAKEATWEDIDLDTGKLKDSYPTYAKDNTGGSNTFIFSLADTWYIKPLTRSLILPYEPNGVDPTEFWFLRFSNGDLQVNTNNQARHYYLPEYSRQAFIPARPTRFSPYEKMYRVNKNVLKASREDLDINPDQGLHLNLFIYDSEGILVKVLTTDTSLEGVRYHESEVFYETDKIVSWDNQSGMISLSLDLHRSWELTGRYYYNATDYEYTLVDLNPFSNKKIFDHFYVFYIIPDASTEDRAIHHLEVDADGVITKASQSLGLNYGNLQLLNSDGSFNSDTVVGMKYVSDDPAEETFISRYTVGFENNHAYGILAEVSLVDTSILERQVVFDVKRRGFAIEKDFFEDAIIKNPKILQSSLGYGEQGQVVPKNNVMILKAPLALLSEYGGDLEEDQVEKLLKTHAAATGATIIDWDYPAVELTGSSVESGVVDLSWTWEGPDLDYRIYRVSNSTGELVLLDTVSSPVEGTILYEDIDVSSGEIWYYQVRIYDGEIEYPAKYQLSIKVK